MASKMAEADLASHAVVFRGLVLPPPHKRLWGRGNTSPLKTTAREAKAD